MNKTFIFIIAFVFFSSLVTSQSGCFLYTESTLYCQTIDETQAQEECSTISDCDLSTSFLPNQNCQDSSAFPNCQKIVCKSSCQPEYQSKCSSGAIPTGEEQSWCQTGCCQFIPSSQPEQSSCTFQQRKSLCENFARNNEAPQFTFIAATNNANCPQLCANSNNSTSSSEKSLSEKVTPLPAPKQATSRISPPDPTLTQITSSNNQKEISPSENVLITNPSLIFLITGIILFICYLWYHSSLISSAQKESQNEVLENDLDDTENALTDNPPLSSLVEPPEPLPLHSTTQATHLQKVKEHSRQDFFSAFAALSDTSHTSLQKLQQLTRLYHQTSHKIPAKLTTVEKKAIEKLQALVAPLPFSRTIRSSSSSPNSKYSSPSFSKLPYPKPSFPKAPQLSSARKKEINEVIITLRKIAQNKS